MSSKRTDQQQDILCNLCRKSCTGEKTGIESPELFDNCLKVMRDDLAVSLEILRLNSPVDRVLCNFKSFFNYIKEKNSDLLWYNNTEKKEVVISVSELSKSFLEALKRWLFDIPENLSEKELESYLASMLTRGEDNYCTLTSSYGELDSYPVLEKIIVTDCPECGKEIRVKLDEGDLENMAAGARMIHKAVEHETDGNIHVINLFIDSDYRIRRKHAIKLIKALK